MKSLVRWCLFAAPALVSAHAVQQLLPRQTAFSNTTTFTRTSPPSSVTPAPCCWIVGGEVAVVLNRWYSSAAENVVATIITTYIRENNGSAIAANSTTIHVPAAGNASYPTPGFYGAQFGGSNVPWVTVPGVPGDLLGGDLTAGRDYDGTSIVNATVAVFASTTLQITSPTPYDEWFKLGIYTGTPTSEWDNVPSTEVDVWRSSMCGTWSYKTYALSSTTKITSGTATITSTTIWPGTTTESLFVPQSWVGTEEFDRFHWQASSQATLLSSVTYIKPRETILPDKDWQLPLPSDVVLWLATQENVVAQYPFIGECWVLDGEGQPVVHVPVSQLTVTSSKIIDVTNTGVVSNTPTTTSTVAASAHTEISQTSLNVPSPTTQTSKPRAEPIKLPPTTTIETSQAPDNTDTGDKDGPPPSQVTRTTTPIQQGGTQGNNPQSTPSQGNLAAGTPSASAGVLPPLISAINSLASQQQTTQIPEVTQQSAVRGTKSGAATIAPAQSANKSVTGFLVGTQTASPGGMAVTAGGSTFSALPSGSGLQIVAGGQTSTIPVAAVPESGNSPSSSLSAGAPAVIDGQTLSAGGNAVTSGNAVFSALPSGQGIQVVSSGETSTILPAPAGPNIGALGSSAFLVGDQTVSAGGIVVVEQGTTYSAMPSESGVLVAAYDETSTIQPTRAGPSVGPLGPSAFLVGDQTVSAGGSVVVEQGTTYSAMPSGSRVVVAANGKIYTTTVDSGGITPRPVIIPVDASSVSSLITLGGQVYTVQATESPLLVIGSQMLTPGGTAVINGETLTLSETNLVVVSGTATATEGLGGAIISGIGGGSETATQSSSPAPQTTSAACLAVLPNVLAGFLAAFVVAGVIM